jgi:radical SAM superfamily enzyme YgiQ (UPF0313 family)
MAKIVMINPPQLYTLTQIASVSVPPIGAAYIASYLRHNGHDVYFIDAYGEAMDSFSKRKDFNLRGLNFAEIIDRIPAEVGIIALGNLFSHAWPVVRDLAQELKKQFYGVPIVTGGIHPTSLPEFVLSHELIDYVILGEGEQTMLELAERVVQKQPIEDLDGLAFMLDGKPVVNNKTRLIDDLDILPFPAYDMIPINNYIEARSPHGASRGRWLPMIATRGCPYACTFCTAETMWLTKWRSRSVENVVDEMEHWNKTLQITDFHFEDLTIVLNKRWALDFCNEILVRNLKITWQMPNGTRSEVVDDEIIEKLKDSGCTNITFAPESGSYKTLIQVKKELDLENIVRASKRAIKKKMVVCCFFIIGFPHETLSEIKETYKFIRRLARIGVNEISITTFTALPGSKLFDQLIKDDRIELNDKFFRELLYMSDLSWAPSWIEGISDSKIARLANWGYFQFFFISYLFRPGRFIRTLINIFRGVEETKLERVGYEKLSSARKLLAKLIKKKPTKAQELPL